MKRSAIAGIVGVIALVVIFAYPYQSDENTTEEMPKETTLPTIEQKTIEETIEKPPSQTVQTKQEEQPTTPPPVVQQKAKESSCDPSYPDVCIPPYPPDLDCGEIPYKNFRVLPPDRHGFDRDNDGIGCES